MTRTRTRPFALFALVAAALCAAALGIATSPFFPRNTDVLAFGITTDLTLGIPLLFFLLVARPLRLSRLTLAPVFVVSVVVASYILPASGHAYLDMVKLALPLLELALIAVVLVKARSIAVNYRAARQDSPYFIDTLEASARRTFGAYPAVTLLVTELTLITLAVWGWFARYTPRQPQHVVFSYHRTSVYSAVFVVLLVIITLETVALHLFVQHWSPLAAWVLTGLSIYSLLWIVGDFHAIRLHPIVGDGDTLHLRCGLRWRATIRIDDIAATQAPRRMDAKAPDYLSLALTGHPQFVLVLTQPIVVHGLFGIQKQVQRLGVFVDDPALFRKTITR